MSSVPRAEAVRDLAGRTKSVALTIGAGIAAATVSAVLGCTEPPIGWQGAGRQTELPAMMDSGATVAADTGTKTGEDAIKESGADSADAVTPDDTGADDSAVDSGHEASAPVEASSPDDAGHDAGHPSDASHSG